MEELTIYSRDYPWELDYRDGKLYGIFKENYLGYDDVSIKVAGNLGGDDEKEKLCRVMMEKLNND